MFSVFVRKIHTIIQTWLQISFSLKAQTVSTQIPNLEKAVSLGVMNDSHSLYSNYFVWLNKLSTNL